MIMVLVIMMIFPWSSHLIRFLLLSIHPPIDFNQNYYIQFSPLLQHAIFDTTFVFVFVFSILCVFCVWSNLCSHFNIYIYENRIFFKDGFPYCQLQTPHPPFTPIFQIQASLKNFQTNQFLLLFLAPPVLAKDHTFSKFSFVYPSIYFCLQIAIVCTPEFYRIETLLQFTLRWLFSANLPQFQA